MVRFGRLLGAFMLAAVGGAPVGVGVSVGVGAAEQCLPPPQVLLSEVARVAGTASKPWADIQAVEQADAAAGTSAPGQVLQDMLTAVTSDGYQWDCGSSQLIAPAGAPPRIDLPPDTTPVTAPGSAATVSGHPATAGGTTVTGAGGTTVPGAGGTAAVGGTTVPGTQGPADTAAPSPNSSILAAPAASQPSTGSGLSTYLLIALAAATGLLVVLVVRRQMGKR